MSTRKSADWSALMDPDFWLPPISLAARGNGSSCRASVSEQRTDSSAGVAVSLPRPTFLEQHPDLLEGSGND